MAPCHCCDHLAAVPVHCAVFWPMLPMPPSGSPMPPAPEFRSAGILVPGMKLGVVVATVTGLALLIALLVYNDAAAVFATVGQGRAGGSQVSSLCARRALVLAGFRLGEAGLRRSPSVRRRTSTCGSAGFVNPLTFFCPSPQVGGDLMGGRLLTFWGVSAGRAGASILVDLVLQLGTQFPVHAGRPLASLRSRKPTWQSSGSSPGAW